MNNQTNYETFKKRNGYIAIHKDTCGHLRKHGGIPKDPNKYQYNRFPTLINAHGYAQATGLQVKICKCV